MHPRANSDSPVKYRPDIDGLRALAVLMVLGNHLGSTPTGGFIGVDVFFVISGYLISASILAEMQDNRFSIVSFYERRIRRIFPAMLAMLLIVSFLAYHYLLPGEVVDYARSLLAALASGSNFWFWHQGGYFDLPGATKPLLHTWSLGVEEQFYILFPLFLTAIRRWLPTRLKPAILWLALASFVAACITMRDHDIAAFFFAPLRAWELLAGTIISQHYVPAPRTPLQRNLATLAGICLILIPAIVYTSYTPFPGLSALPPCLGSALIIAAGENGSSLVSRILSWKPITFIGLISYSLYLWHWPIIVFQQFSGLLVAPTQFDHRVKLLLIVVSIAVATLSWKFIEQPFRKGALRPGRRTLFTETAIVTLLLAAVGCGLIWSNGIPSRFPPDAQKIAEYGHYSPAKAYRTHQCFIVTPEDTFANYDQKLCLPDAPGKPSILLAGDSYSAMLWSGLAATYPDYNLLQADASDCRPLLANITAHRNRSCRQLLSFLYNDYLPTHHIDTFLLAGNWHASDLAGIPATLDFLRAHGIHVVMLGPLPGYSMDPPRILALELRAHQPDITPQYEVRTQRDLDHEMATLARTTWHIPYISFFEDLCKPDCPVYAAPGVPMVFSGGHVTAEGSLLIMQTIRAHHQLP